MTAGRLVVALIMDGPGRLKGLFTDGDFRRALMKAGVTTSDGIDSHITERPLTVNADVRLVEAEELMRKSKVRCLVVTDGKPTAPIGLVELFDFRQRDKLPALLSVMY